MGRHDRHDALSDGGAVKTAEACLPRVHRQGVDRGHKVLVAVVKAFAGPMLDGGGDACGLKFVNLGKGLLSDHLDIAAKTPCRDDGTAKRGIDVDDGSEGPVDADGARLLPHDARDGTAGLHVVHGGQGQRVGHLGADAEAHPAAFQIGRDEQRHVRGPLQGVNEVLFVIEVCGEIAGDAGRAQTGQSGKLFRVLAHGVKDKELADLFSHRQAGLGGPDPGDLRVVQMERRQAQKFGQVCHGHSLDEVLEAGIGIEPIYADLQSAA